jgi:surface carbohydrate biosynthesis protein
MRIFGRNFIFKNPLKVDILIFDECNSEYVKTVLNEKYSVGIFRVRPYEIILTPLIIKNFIKGIRQIGFENSCTRSRGIVYGLFFQLRAIYIEACLIATSPKAVITMIDNSNTFHWLSRYSRKFPYIAIQNGNRLRFELAYNKEYYIQHFFCWGANESKVFNELGCKVENYYPVGSLLASLHFDNVTDESISSRFDVLIVSTWRGNIGYSVDVVDTMKSMKAMDELLSKYIKLRKINASVILRSERNSEHWNVEGFGNEYDYYRSIYGNSVHIEEANFTARNVYQSMQQSRLIISCLSGALIEAYGIGKKILYFNYTGKKIYHCDFDSKFVIEENDFSKVVQIIDELLDQSENEYHTIHLENIKTVMSYPEDAPTYDEIKSKIDEIIDRHNSPITT